MKVAIRKLQPSDVPELWNLFYYAISVPPGEDPPPKDIIKKPELSKYVQDFGKGDDLGFMATTQNGKVAAAVWIRQFTRKDRGYGYVDDRTPELSIVVKPPFQGRGIGTTLLDHLLSSTACPSRVSLSVSDYNPARRLYERFGFHVVGKAGDSTIMLLDMD